MKFFYILVTLLLLHHTNADPLDENYGYVDVREGAHMFWVVYHTELAGDWSTHPLILWLQGGPGSSGVGYGNFWELGPRDINGNLRDGRWTKKANVMFVDNPVGTGYSYVDSPTLYCTNNTQIANDLVTLITSVFTDYPDMQKMPFFIYAESYGGKMTADFAVALDAAIARGDIVSNFQGIAMGDSWISPMDSVNTWGSYLYWMGMVNKEGQALIDASAARTQEAVDNEDWVQATAEWSITEGVVEATTHGVDFYNVLVEDSDSYFVPGPDDEKKYSYLQPEIRKLFYRHVMPYSKKVGDDLDDFMNGPQKAHWNISDDVTWGGQSGYVFDNLRGDFMKPVVESVAYLLNNSHIHVAVYSGDLDLICDTPGTYLWIDNMQYSQKSGYTTAKRDALYISTYPNVAAYNQRFERFSVFTILRSGHMVPLDAPEMSLNMIDIITGYGNETVSSKFKAETAKKILHTLKVKQASEAVQKAKVKHEAKGTVHEKVEEIHGKKQETEKMKEKLSQIKHENKNENVANKLAEAQKTKEVHDVIEKVKEHEPKNAEEREKLHEKVKAIEAELKKEREQKKHKAMEAIEKFKENHEEEEKAEAKEKILEKVDTIKNDKNEEKEKALKKLRLKKKMLAYKGKNTVKENQEVPHPNSLHSEPEHNSKPEHDSKLDKAIQEQLKALFQKKISLNLQPQNQ